jgi:hypothetical protein
VYQRENRTQKKAFRIRIKKEEKKFVVKTTSTPSTQAMEQTNGMNSDQVRTCGIKLLAKNITKQYCGSLFPGDLILEHEEQIKSET